MDDLIDQSPEKLDDKSLTPKEKARQFRREAYRLAKERRASDPRFLAQKQKQRELRREAYQKAKELRKAQTKEEKSARDQLHLEVLDQRQEERDAALKAMLTPASELVSKPRRHLRLVKG